MAIDIINVGTVPNDDTGDSLRNAFIKVNSNFADPIPNSRLAVMKANSVKINPTNASALPIDADETDITEEVSPAPGMFVLGWNGTGLVRIFDFGNFPAATESFVIAASDETTDLTTGTAKLTFRMPYAFTVDEVRASVTTAPTGSVLTVDINETGVTILSTKITIDATEFTSKTAATPPVISDSSLADDAQITIDIDTIGSTIAGAGLKVYIIGRQT